MSRTWLSVTEATKYFNLKSPKTLYSLAARNRLPRGSVLYLGRQIRICVEAVEEEARGKNDKKERKNSVFQA